MNIFVGSLPFSIEEADLRESFEAYRQLIQLKLSLINLQEGRFGFVEMPNDDEAQKQLTN
jgi:RNA recognition motif-containing protein